MRKLVSESPKQGFVSHLQLVFPKTTRDRPIYANTGHTVNRSITFRTIRDSKHLSLIATARPDATFLFAAFKDFQNQDGWAVIGLIICDKTNSSGLQFESVKIYLKCPCESIYLFFPK